MIESAAQRSTSVRRTSDQLRFRLAGLGLVHTLFAVTDTTTRRQAYLDARAALNKAYADLRDGPVPDLTESQLAALIVYEGAREAYLVASRECYGI
jgi:hypothetical protein